jgi:predicted O-linked N-acetylglucosamine transferase (SPINDLY family)
MGKKKQREGNRAKPARAGAPKKRTTGPDEAFKIALEHQQSGNLAEADRIYREVLDEVPDHADSLHFLGLIAHQRGESEEAIELLRRSIALVPEAAVYHSNLGIVLQGQGKLDEAEAAYRSALELEPDLAEAHYNLGRVLQRQRKLDEAEAAYRRALDLRPDYANAQDDLAEVLRKQGKLGEAEAAYRRAVELAPDDPGVHNNLGRLFQAQGKLAEAEAAYRRTLELTPNDPKAHDNVGSVLWERGKLDEANAAYRRALELAPGDPKLHNNLGSVLWKQGERDEAEAAYRHAIDLAPDFAEAHYNLGSVLRNQVKLSEAEAAYRRAIALKPGYPEAQTNLGLVLLSQGKIEDAIAIHRQAVALQPSLADAHSNLLFCLHYMPGKTPEEIFAEHRNWNAQHAAPLAGEIRPYANVPDPNRRMRIAFISGSLRRHPVGYMTLPALEARDGRAWECYIYSNGGDSDDLTERIRAAADIWRDIGELEDRSVSQLIRDDGVDIIVDLSGHASGGRLLALARKPAPVQVKWVGGQFNTSGMDSMDYFLSDVVETPPGAEKWFTEEVVRLPDGYVCYEAPGYAPEVGPLPALKRGYVTFGCFNNLAKINEKVVALWARLLPRLPEARLVLRTLSLSDPSVRKRYHAMFAAYGVGRERVDLLGPSPHADLLACYNEIDIALDPFPYSGGLTTCEALWMGVPVVALAGETFAGRHAASHLHNVGLADWVVESAEDYLAVAERWGRDTAALADLRAGLRHQMAASPLCDGARFARNLETAFRRMWRRWCEQRTANARVTREQEKTA